MSDSSTAHGEEAHIQRSGLRKHTSIRVDSGLWEAFNKACLIDGQRTCEVLELIMLGYTAGILAKKDHQVSNGAQSTTINVTANLLKQIKRERRYGVEGVGDADAGSARGEHATLCHFCLLDGRRVEAVGTYTYVKTMEVFGLCHFHAQLMLDSGKWR